MAPTPPPTQKPAGPDLTDPNTLLSVLQGVSANPQASIDALFSTDPNARVATGNETKTRYTLSGSYNETTPVTKTVADLVKQFYTIEGPQLRELQNDLFVGGFYGQTDPSSISWGQQDNATYSAYLQAVVRASRYYAAGKNLTVDDVLNLAAQTAGKEGRAKTPAVAQLTDPAGLASTIDDATLKVLGRKATIDEKRAFTAAIHSTQRQTAQQLAGASDLTQGVGPDGQPIHPTASRQSVDIVGVDPTARAEMAARAADPTRAGARDLLTSASAMIEMFGGA